jgi:hypothetical protein
MYTTIITRLDIVFSRSKVSLFQERPSQSHRIAVEQIMRYLKRTKRYGMFYLDQTSNLKLLSYTKKDFRGSLDSRKSQTGFVYTSEKRQLFGKVMYKDVLQTQLL